MNSKQIHKFVERYLEATGCIVLEKSPAHYKVKLSPQADRELTNRPYYWSFVDRTGTEPETMTFLFITDRAKYEESRSGQTTDGAASPQQSGVEAALGRTFGHLHGTAIAVRTPEEELHYGSRRLEQLFEAARNGGKYVYLFQQPSGRAVHPLDSSAYTPWLGVNLKIGFECDRRKEELHSFGVSLATGVCVENFHTRLLGLRMTPRLPANVHIAKSSLTPAKAAGLIETVLERKLRAYDYSWADAAAARLEDELTRVRSYYEPLIESAEDEAKRETLAAQFENRRTELAWQLQPRVTATAVNAGIFHLAGIE